MARTFRRPHNSHPISELNVIPLIDLAFALLIIFMISTPLITKDEQAIPVDLPVSVQTAPARPNQKFVKVVILAGNYNVDGTVMSTAQLNAFLRTFANSPEPPVFSIRADRNIPYQEVVTLLDLLSQNNLNKISLDTQAAGRR